MSHCAGPSPTVKLVNELCNSLGTSIIKVAAPLFLAALFLTSCGLSSQNQNSPLSASAFNSQPSISSGYPMAHSDIFDFEDNDIPTGFRFAHNPKVGAEISPESAVVPSGGTQQFTARIRGIDNAFVIWSTSTGTISKAGLFTAPVVHSAITSTITATISAGHPQVTSAVVTVAALQLPLSITTSNLPEAQVGNPYSVTLSASGGMPPYYWAISQGSLPGGVQFDPTTGAIKGSTYSSGSFSFNVAVTDGGGRSAQQSLVLTVSGGSSCGPPIYSCSRSDSSFVPVPNPMPNWGGVLGVNTVNNDPDFHNPILRFTDGATEGGFMTNAGFCTGMGGSGDVPQLWNADDTILVVCEHGGRYFPVGFDPVNFKSLGPLYGNDPVFASGPGVFSHTNPNLFYAIQGGQLETIDYTDRTTRPTPQLVYDFRNCGIASIGWQSIGGSDPTDTIFSAAFSLTLGQGTGYYVAVYNSSTGVCFNLNTSTGLVTRYPGGTIVGTVNIPDRFYVHNLKMKGGSMLVVASQSCIANCGKSPYAWVIGTTQMDPLGSPQGGGHWAAGCGKWLNQPGNPYYYNVTRDYTNPVAWGAVWATSASQCGAAPRMACAQPFDSHPAWLGDCSDTGPVCMATASTNDIVQYPYQNEIVCFTTDGSNQQIRFAHTYATVTLQGFSGAWSIGQPSPDGKFYAWTTSAGGQFGCTDGTFNCSLRQRRSDVLIVKLQ